MATSTLTLNLPLEANNQNWILHVVAQIYGFEVYATLHLL